MMMFGIMAACMYPCLLLVFALIYGRSKPHNGLLFGAWLPEFRAKEPEVDAICRSFRKQMRLTLVVLLLVPLTFLLVPYTSVQLSLWILYIFAAIVVLYVPYVGANRAIRAWKQQAGEDAPRERVIFAELQQGPRTLRFTAFLPATVVSALTIVFATVVLRTLGVMVLSVVTFAVMTPLFGLCAVWMDRQRLKVISADSHVNLNYNRALRRQWKLFWLYSAWMNTLFSLVIAFIFWQGSFEAGVSALLYGGLIYTALLLLALVWLMVKNHRLNKTYRDKMDLVGYVDDDENWLWGLVYYNPGDFRVSVEKRFGMGTTINMATPVGKALAVFLAVVLAGTLVLCGWMMLVEFTPIRLSVEGEQLVAAQINDDYTIALKELEQVELLSERPGWTRVNGTGMDTLLKGTFRLRDTGERVEVFLDPENVYCIRFSDGETTYYMSCAEDGQTLALYEQIKD